MRAGARRRATAAGRIAMLAAAALALAPPGSAQTCGNALREPPEHCDDGNARSADGCSAACAFEQTLRATRFRLQAGTDAACPANQFGFAFVSSLTLSSFQDVIDAAVADGSLSLLLPVLGLDDLEGADDPALELGVLSGAPILPGSVAYDGTDDRDWWLAPHASGLDAAYEATHRLPGVLAASELEAGPGFATVRLPLGGEPAPVSFSSLVIRGSTGSVAVPPLAAGGLPPGHVPYENLDPTLQSFASLGAPAVPDWATWCGDLSTASLRDVAIPGLLTGTACSGAYTAANSLLDLLVSGCTAFGSILLTRPVQPDRANPGAPPAGMGQPYTLSANASRVVTTCRDSSSAVVDLETCLQDASYSSYFRFTAGRVILTLDALFDDGFDGT